MAKKEIVLIGANGMLASMLRKSAPQSVDLQLFDLPEFDITDAEQVDKTLTAIEPDVVINCAAFTQVDACETHQEIAFQVNGRGPGILAAVVRNIGAILVHISTDFVFSGVTNTPYLEEDPTAPLSVYGESKLQGEQAIFESGLTDYYIVRTSWLYGPGGSNFVETMIRLASERKELGIVADQIGTPTFTGDLAAAVWTLLGLDGDRTIAAYGIYHYSNDGMCSWYDFTCEIIAQLREGDSKVVETINPIATADYPLPATRPAYSVLNKEKIIRETGLSIPCWQDSLRTYMNMRLGA